MLLFDLPDLVVSKQDDKAILNKTTKKQAKVVARGGSKSLIEIIKQIEQSVTEKLGHYLNDYLCIRDEQSLKEYIDKCIEQGEATLDTETTGLNPMLDKIAGFSIYTPGQKAAYVPINHRDYITNELIPNQLPVNFCKEQLQRLHDNNVKMVMFNAPFDIRVVLNQVGTRLPIYWDVYIAQKLLNENESSNKLKELHRKYVMHNQEDAFSFSDLFDKSVTFDLIPIKVGYIYAARDALVTYELYQFQKQYLDPSSPLCKEHGLEEVYKVFMEIEMPVVDVVVDMEQNGIKLDLEYANKLSIKYNAMLEERINHFYEVCKKYEDKIEAYKKVNPNHGLSTPINIGSSSQIATLLYDILELEPISKKLAGKTGVEVLEAYNLDICKAILDYREITKLLSTYIDKLPKLVVPKDGKIHCRFNQYGAKTGRFSSDNPNLQNIPSKNEDIRKMFVADEGCLLMSSDYS